MTDAYAARRIKCQVPDELRWQSKPQLAAAMLQSIAHEGILPFKYVVADCLYDNSPDFLDAVDACVGVTLLDQAHNALERKLFAMKGFHHPGGSQQAFLTGVAHLYNLIPYQRR